MNAESHQHLLHALLDSWDRNNAVLINLLRAIPDGGLEARAMTGSPTVAEMFTHMHHERMVSVLENAPEHAGEVPAQEWNPERDARRIAEMLEESARHVRDAVTGRIEAERDLDRSFAHPVQLVQFLIFHEGYHHGQIKLALKAAGCPIADADAGPLTWDVWRARNEHLTIGGEPVVTLERPAPQDASHPAFVGAQVLPGRGMMTLQIRAHLPGRGATDLLAAPPFERAREILDGEEEHKGNSSFFFGAPVLLPFANRIRGTLQPDGRTIEASILGKTVRLLANAGGRKPGAERLAMHGLLLAAPFREVRRETTDEEDAVRGTFQAGDFEGHWLSATEVTCEVVLRSDSFTLAVTARNVGDEPLPMGIGWHPYFALPSGRRTQARLRIPARRRLLVHDYDEVIPTGEVVPVAGTPYDFSAPEGQALGDLFLDDCFVDLERTAEGRVVAEILDPEAGHGVRIVTDAPHLRAIQVFAPQDIGFVAFEPQLNWVDPFGPEWEPEVDTGMATLAPGESASYRVRLELIS